MRDLIAVIVIILILSMGSINPRPTCSSAYEQGVLDAISIVDSTIVEFPIGQPYGWKIKLLKTTKDIKEQVTKDKTTTIIKPPTNI